MKVVVLNEYGGVEKFEFCDDVFELLVGVGEIKVCMVGVSINFIDWKLRSGVYWVFMLF